MEPRTDPPGRNELQWWHWQQTGTGPPLLLLHGLGGSRFSWRRTVPALARSFTVFTLDLPGHGQAPVFPERDWSLEALAAEILIFLDHQGLEQPVLVGHSLGGTLAILLAGCQPQRFPALILLAPGILLAHLPLLLVPLRFPGLDHLAPFVVGPWLIPWILRRLYYDPRQVTPEVIAGYQRPFRRLARRREVAQLCRHLKLWPLAAQERWLTRLTLPTLIIWGEADRLFPVGQARRLQRLLPQAAAFTIPGVGHNPQEEAPERVHDLMIAFLRRWLAR